jgi:putative aldouronate transport system permease protein
VHVTLPGIKATFVVLLIINIGNLLEAGYEQQYLLKNGLVQDYAEVFNVYVLRYGFDLMRFSYAAAAGLFRSLVSILLIVIANSIARRIGEESLI